MKDYIEFMKSLDQAYRASTGLENRKYYSIFYSQINPSRIMVIGFNPGGDVEEWDESKLASRSFFEHAEHEYVDCNYRIAKVMRCFLVRVLALKNTEEIRRIPKTNLIFRRSSSQDSLSIPKSQAILEAKPILESILQVVMPKAIICEGITTLEAFEQHYCSSVVTSVDGINVHTPNGKNRARIYQADRAQLDCVGSHVALIGIGHPSTYGVRVEWQKVVTASKMFLSNSVAA